MRLGSLVTPSSFLFRASSNSFIQLPLPGFTRSSTTTSTLPTTSISHPPPPRPLLELPSRPRRKRTALSMKCTRSYYPYVAIPWVLGTAWSGRNIVVAITRSTQRHPKPYRPKQRTDHKCAKNYAPVRQVRCLELASLSPNNQPARNATHRTSQIAATRHPGPSWTAYLSATHRSHRHRVPSG